MHYCSLAKADGGISSNIDVAWTPQPASVAYADAATTVQSELCLTIRICNER